MLSVTDVPIRETPTSDQRRWNQHELRRHILSAELTPSWQLSEQTLPTTLIGAQVGTWDGRLHLINGIYNSTQLNLSGHDNADNRFIWLFSDDTMRTWDFVTASNSLGGHLCYAQCSSQIGRFLYVVSPEELATASPTGLLVVYDLSTMQVEIPPIGLTETPYFWNGGACVTANASHLFIAHSRRALCGGRPRSGYRTMLCPP